MTNVGFSKLATYNRVKEIAVRATGRFDCPHVELVIRKYDRWCVYRPERPALWRKKEGGEIEVICPAIPSLFLFEGTLRECKAFCFKLLSSVSAHELDTLEANHDCARSQ